MLNDNILDTFIFSQTEIKYKKFHCARTLEAFRFLNINLDEEITACYDTLEKQYSGNLRDDECLRVVFSVTNPPEYSVAVRKLEALNREIKLDIVSLPSPPGPDRAFKWENRQSWELLAKNRPAGADDTLVLNSGVLVETSRFNIFCYDAAADLILTPELGSGCLNGVLRRFAIATGFLTLPGSEKIKIVEKNINCQDILNNKAKYKIYVGNSVRGLLPATLLNEMP